MTMLTECCEVEPHVAMNGEEVLGYWFCPKCHKQHPPCKILPETPKQVFDRKCEEINEPKEAVADRAWNAALEAVREELLDAMVRPEPNSVTRWEPFINEAQVAVAVARLLK